MGKAHGPFRQPGIPSGSGREVLWQTTHLRIRHSVHRQALLASARSKNGLDQKREICISGARRDLVEAHSSSLRPCSLDAEDLKMYTNTVRHACEQTGGVLDP